MNRAAWTAIAIIAILLGVVAVVRFTQGPPQGSVDGQPPSEEPVTPFFRQGATDQPHSDDVRTPLTEAQQREMERIATLGYVAGTRPAGPRDGVVTHVPEATFPGYTLYTGGEGHEAFLIDLEGNIAHTWSYPGSKGWTRVRVMPNGDLFAITASPPKFLKLSRDSELLWSFEVHSHHDFTVLPDSTICVLVRGNTARRGLNHGRPVIDDHIVLLDKHGKELSFISLLKAFERSEFGGSGLSTIRHPMKTTSSTRTPSSPFRETGVFSFFSPCATSTRSLCWMSPPERSSGHLPGDGTGSTRLNCWVTICCSSTISAPAERGRESSSRVWLR